MRRIEPQSLGELLRNAIEESCLGPELEEYKAVKAWPAVIGAQVASKTMKPFISKGVMKIRVPSAPLRQELNMMRTVLARAINAEIGKEIVKELKFLA